MNTWPLAPLAALAMCSRMPAPQAPIDPVALTLGQCEQYTRCAATLRTIFMQHPESLDNVELSLLAILNAARLGILHPPR
jgi:hypothetical protein